MLNRQPHRRCRYSVYRYGNDRAGNQPLMDAGHSFESFVHQVLLARYPAAGIKKVDGAGGDRGVDSFEGILSDGPSIWQCKNYAMGSEQVKKRLVSSNRLRQLLNIVPLLVGTLCVPIDRFGTSGNIVGFSLKSSNPISSRTKITLVQNSDLLRDVSQNPDLSSGVLPGYWHREDLLKKSKSAF